MRVRDGGREMVGDKEGERKDDESNLEELRRERVRAI